MFKNIEDCLGEGKFIIKVFPADKWDTTLNEGRGGFSKGVQQTVAVKGGKTAYKYNVETVVRNGIDEKLRYDNGEGKEYRCSVLAFDEKSKAILDTGTAEINIVPKLDKGEAILKMKDGVPTTVLKFYINPLPRLGLPVGDQSEGANRLYNAPETKDFNEEDIPVIEADEELNEDEVGY